MTLHIYICDTTSIFLTILMQNFIACSISYELSDKVSSPQTINASSDKTEEPVSPPQSVSFKTKRHALLQTMKFALILLMQMVMYARQDTTVS